MAKSKYTTIPRRGKSDPQFDAIAANLEQLTGQKGNGAQRALLVEDLKDLGIATFSGGKLRIDPDFNPGTGTGGGGVTPPTPPVIEPPTTPTGFRAVGAFQNITFYWDAPTYVGHAYTEIFTSETDNFSTAARIGVTSASVYGYSTPFGWKGFAWIRHVNQSGATSPLNATNGTPVNTSTDIDELLDEMKDKIGEDFFDDNMDEQLEWFHDSIEWMEKAKADGMLEETVTQDTYSVERRFANKTLTARIDTEYYTGVDTDKAIATATTQLRAIIEDPDGSSVGADLKQNYYTAAKTDEAIAAATLTLRTDLDNLSATLTNSYYTKVDTDKAIASATTTLKSEIEDPDGTSIGADLKQNYYTKVDTDGAISQATTKLKADIEDPDGNSLGASLDETKKALAQTDGYQEALWGVKATAGDVTASIGLVAKSNPNDPSIDNAYFIVQDADMRVVYTKDDSTGEEDVVPIFGTMDNPDYDPNDPDSSPKILVIDTASIKVANIKELIVGDLVADSLVVGSEIVTPIIKTPTINAPGDNFYVTDVGDAFLRGEIDAQSGTFRGTIEANDGVFNGTVSGGRVEGTNIVGGTIRGATIYASAIYTNEEFYLCLGDNSTTDKYINVPVDPGDPQPDVACTQEVDASISVTAPWGGNTPDTLPPFYAAGDITMDFVTLDRPRYRTIPQDTLRIRFSRPKLGGSGFLGMVLQYVSLDNVVLDSLTICSSGSYTPTAGANLGSCGGASWYCYSSSTAHGGGNNFLTKSVEIRNRKTFWGPGWTSDKSLIGRFRIKVSSTHDGGGTATYSINVDNKIDPR